MQKVFGLTMFILLLIVPPALSAAENEEVDHQGRGWALDTKLGTLGIGVDLNRSIIPCVLNLRVGASFFSHSINFNDEGINYNAKLKLGAVPIAVDVFPFKNWFRLGGGVVISLNEMHASGQTSTGTWEIGDGVYTAQDIGQMYGKIKANRVAPYLGLGFNNPITRKGHLGFFADLGLLYHGTPSAVMTTTKTVPQLQADIDKEIRDVNDDIREFKLFPVVQLGFSYRF